MKKRLIIVIWNMGIGGIQKRMRDVAIDISKHRKDWEVFFLIRRKTPSPFLDSLLSRERVHIMYYPFQSIIRFPLGFVAWVALQYARIRPKVTLTFLAQLTIMMMIIRKIVFWQKTVLIVNEGAHVSGYLIYNKLGYLKGLLRIVYQSVDRIIVPTLSCKSDLINSFFVPSDQIFVVPNWTLLSALSPYKTKYDFAYVGRLEHEKNPLVVVEVVKNISFTTPSIRCIVVGDGTLKRQLEEMIKASKLQTNISILSRPINTKCILRQSRILIVPSYNEGMPNVVLEAAMCGVPAIANNFQGSEEVIMNGKTGFIANNVDDMASKAQLLLDNPKLLKRVGIQARRYVAKHFHHQRQEEFITILLGRN